MLGQRLRKQEIREKKRGEKRQKEELGLLVEDEAKREFRFDAEDRRFEALGRNPEYAIDPTSVLYKEDRAGKVLEEQVRRKKLKK